MSKRSGSKTRGGADGKEEEACPPWVLGIRCVLDVMLTHDNEPRLTPPIRQYLEEVSLGMIGGSGDGASQAQADRKRKPGEKPTPACCMKVMLRVIADDPSTRACQSLFWLVLGAIFGTVRSEAAPAFKKQLGEAWYAFTLQVMDEVEGDTEVQDWILAAMPCVFAQAIYRLLVDGFVEDRKHFVKEGHQLLSKVSFVIHFELTGFQITAETLRRSRQRLFLKQVVQAPHVNQHQVMKGKKRQEILESTAADKDQPLAFAGVEAARDEAVTPTGRLEVSVQALEESQLEHILQGSEMRRREDEHKAANMQATGKGFWEIEPTPVPAKYSVARYRDLAEGALIFERHMAELSACASNEDEDGDDDTAEDEQLPSSLSSPPESPLPSPMNATSPRFSEAGDTTEISDCTSVPTTPSKSKRMWRKATLVAKCSVQRDEARLKKEREAKARKVRQETLQRKCSEPLIKELSERTLNTTWVSPAMMSLQNAQGRQTLKKTSSESFQLKMAVKKEPWRRLSMPALKSAAKDESSPTRQKKPLDASTCGGSHVSPERREESIAGSVRTGNPHMRDAAGRARAVGAGTVEAQAAPAQALPRFGKQLEEGRLQGKKDSHVISLDPPARLSGKAMRQRVETQDKANQTQSFAIYMKEHDVFTGVRKLRFDDKRLRDEEDAYVKKLCGLVGGNPKRLINPERLLQQFGGGGAGRASTPPAAVQDTAASA